MRILETKEVYRRLLDVYGSQHWWPANTKFEIAIGAILTQNTMWRNVEVSIKNLENAGLLEPYRMYIAAPEKLASLVKPSGFPRLKADRLKNFLSFFSQFSFDFDKLSIFDTDTIYKKFMNVNGIGKETANSILLYIFERPVIIIDAYTKRFFSRLAIPAERYASIPEEMNKNSKDLGEFHALIVQHSKAYCRAKPACENCPLSDLCKYGGT